MHIERAEDVQISLKRIARIKKKYGLITKKRKRSNLKKGMISMKENVVCENLLNQSFNISTPDQVYSTDVTFLTNKKGKRAYLSGVKDLCTREVVGYSVSETNDLELVLKSLRQLSRRNLRGPLIHSDQGHQYTSPVYQSYLKRKGMIQSMSRKGNCYDNAPIESFFGHLKDECDYRNWETIDELERKIGKYIKYYNEKRPQWGLQRKTPVEYRSFLS